MGSGLDPRWERLIISRGSCHSRLTIEAPARVFHQGPGHMPNMTGCSFAVRHLLHRTARWKSKPEQENRDELKTVRVPLANFWEALVVEANRRCAASSRSVQRPKGARSTAMLGLWR
jgi:hypothetical protein